MRTSVRNLTVRSTSGEVTGLSSQAGWVRLPHGLLRSDANTYRVEVQMGARLLWEQETAFICGSLRDGRFDSEVPD